MLTPALKGLLTAQTTLYDAVSARLPLFVCVFYDC